MPKPSEYFLQQVAEWQDLSVRAEIDNKQGLQRLADYESHVMLMYAAFFRTIRL